MLKWKRLTAGALTAAVVLAVGAPSAAGLEPKEVVVLYRQNDAQSKLVADYYVHARGIPQANEIALRCNAGETISEADYRTSIVPQVRKALADRGLTDRTKCLATVYGLPLKIGPEEVEARQRIEAARNQQQLDQTLKQLSEAVAAYSALGGGPPPTAATAPATKPAATPAWGDLVRQLNAAASAAGRRVEAMAGDQRSHGLLQMEELQRRVAGIAGVLASFHVNPDAPDDDPGRAQLSALQAQLNDIQAEAQAVRKLPRTEKTRGQLVALETRARGLIGQAQQLMANVAELSPTETESCFDNELSLVLADQNYPRYRWLLNPKNVEFYPMMRRFKELPQPLMVCRLDGLTASAVTAMIDTTLAVEKKGLDGKLYLDARGMHGTDAYAAYDADIRAAADWLQSNSTMPVVLDDTPGFFQAKNCPDAALYCGWYSLHHYLDSCQWVPGAVGYHVASFEMMTLHNPQETGWVSNLLKRGFCGTLGPTAEPYLTAFPKPSKFFPLLLSGQFTQGEVWEVTMPMASWRMGYVGDPLYNPFKVKPRVTAAALKADTVLRNAFEILRGSTAETQPAR